MMSVVLRNHTKSLVILSCNFDCICLNSWRIPSSYFPIFSLSSQITELQVTQWSVLKVYCGNFTSCLWFYFSYKSLETNWDWKQFGIFPKIVHIKSVCSRTYYHSMISTVFLEIIVLLVTCPIKLILCQFNSQMFSDAGNSDILVMSFVIAFSR